MEQQATSTTMFGQWLRQRRRSLDLTQTALARLVGCSVVTIRKIETGERRPSREMAALLAGLVGIAPGEQAKFVQFARTDVHADAFRHPLLTPPETPLHSTDLLAPEDVFATDAPGWIHAAAAPAPTLSRQLLVMRLTSAPTDSPRSDMLSDGRMLCKIYGQGHIAGHLTGTIAHETTHLVRDTQQADLPCPLSTMFTIETETGSIKGHYTGFTIKSRDGNVDHMRMHGQVLSVTPSFTDLFLAQVFYEGAIYFPGAQDAYATAERGILTILPR
jgi:transcriptional regulator with XRE-family HTH domain